MDERTLLLHADDCSEQRKPFVFSHRSETLQLAHTTLPIFLSFAMQNCVQAWSILMAGTLGDFELRVASYGYMFASCTGSMVAIGGATALDTLCGQAYTTTQLGKSPYILSIYLQRGLLVLCLLFAVVITPLWWVSGKLFIVLGQEHEFAMATGDFLRILIPGGLFQVVAECLKKYLQVQSQRNAVTYIVTISTVVGVFANFAFFRLVKTGIWAAPVSTLIYHLSTTVLLLVFMCRNETTKAKWGGFSKQPFSSLIRIFNLAITGILTVATEWWSFEILAMMAAQLDPVTISTQSILMASDLVFTTVSLGLGVAASHRIGNLLGSDNDIGAKFAARAPYLLSIILGAVEFIGIMAVRHVFGHIFTNDPEVVDLTARILPLMASFQVLDLANGGAGGILRGAGKNHLSGLCNLTAYYGVGLTTAWFLCFQSDLGLFGLWLGIIAGSGVLLILQTSCVLFIHWNKEAHKAANSEH